MLPGQFQLESQRIVTRTPHVDSFLNDEATHAAVISMLAGLSLRNRLCDAEHELLDRLAAHHFVTFMILNDRYIHPEDIELIPVDQIDPTLHNGSDAVFSHRHHLSDELGRKAQTIRTAQVGEIDNHPLVLGMMGPELPELRDHHDHYFGSLVTLFRRTVQNLEPTLAMLTRRLNQPDPTVIVNRSSGRILALNASAFELVSPDGRDVVGEEYSQIKGLLLPFITKGKVAIENRGDSGLNIAIVTVGKQPHAGSPTCPPVAAGFLQRMRHKTSNIASVARHLCSELGQEPGHAITELLQIVLEESTELDRQLWRHQILTEYGKLKRDAVNPVADLRKAIESTHNGHLSKHISLLEEFTQQFKIEVPRQALLFLYEGILKQHGSIGSHPKPIKIVVQNCPSGQGMSILFSSEYDHANVNAGHAEWTDYCDRLAETMGVGLKHGLSKTSGQFETVLTINA